MARPKGTTGIKHLTIANRIRIRTLYHDTHFSQAKIQQSTKFSAHQIRTAIQAPTTEPGRHTSRPAELSKVQKEKLVGFIYHSKKYRQMTFLQLSIALFNGIFSI